MDPSTFGAEEKEDDVLESGYAVGSVGEHVAVMCLDSNANEMSCMFQCRPKTRDGKHHLVAANDILFDPSHYDTSVTGDNEGEESPQTLIHEMNKKVMAPYGLNGWWNFKVEVNNV
ncbi:hypothetical protein C5167_022664 [Papaver somniferum]|uniref:Uncharacterized protein n=1 Tax=Papaver somniferum TaxID=3469 RepID=A0A4Y7JK38_PAPSO|nr:hypothetical protein C5167_022664 [Papaver somniferum]